MVGRNPARYLAPVALVATAMGAYLIVTQHLDTSSPRAAASHAPARHARAHRHFAGAPFYVIQAGDNLTSISVKTGIPVPALEQLNPSLDPNSLQTGQRLRLRR